MSIDPGLIRSERHLEVSALIERDAGILVARWSRRAVHEQPNAQRLHRRALEDHLHDFLIALARSLASSDESDTSQHCVPATIHGEDRWGTGWSLSELVRDYQILRLVILDYLEEVLEGALGTRCVLAINLALDEAIAASVLMYVASRDAYQRQLEEERAERDRQIQEHLRNRADTLREVDRRKNEFMATLGHEMRNPLAPLGHAVRLLEFHDTQDETLLRIRDILKRQVQQLSRLADDLLDISRIAQGKIELRKQPVSLAAILEQAIEISSPHLKARHHQLEVTLPPANLQLDADPTRLTQIIVNLLNNAAKYTEPGGRVWLQAQREGDQAVVHVRDTGMGIPPEMLPNVFEMFTQGEWSAECSQGGIGIGLALVRRLVELHGGAISVQSDGIGQGSQFVVRLPALTGESFQSDRHKQSSDGPLGAIPKPPRRRILIVDDNVDAAASLRMLLALDGHDVQVAYDGQAALRQAEEFQPEVILLDIGLPRMDGYQVARHLRGRQNMTGVLLVALTGYGQEDARRRSQEAGFNAHLVKPLDLAALQAVLLHCERLASGRSRAERHD